MIRRPWLLPITIPILAVWLILRIARLPLNFGLWAISECMDFLILKERSVYWPSWSSLWGSL